MGSQKKNHSKSKKRKVEIKPEETKKEVIPNICSEYASDLTYYYKNLEIMKFYRRKFGGWKKFINVMECIFSALNVVLAFFTFYEGPFVEKLKEAQICVAICTLLIVVCGNYFSPGNDYYEANRMVIKLEKLIKECKNFWITNMKKPINEKNFENKYTYMVDTFEAINSDSFPNGLEVSKRVEKKAEKRRDQFKTVFFGKYCE